MYKLLEAPSSHMPWIDIDGNLQGLNLDLDAAVNFLLINIVKLVQT